MDWLKNIFKSRYVRMLEEENARLREENRAQLNALLEGLGHKTVDYSKADAAALALRRPRNLSLPQMQAKTERDSKRRMLERFRELVLKPKGPDRAA